MAGRLAGPAAIIGLMTIRLYDSAWVRLQDFDAPQQAHKDQSNPAVFHIGTFRYDIDGKPMDPAQGAPTITEMLSMQAARELGLSTQYALRSDVRF